MVPLLRQHTTTTNPLGISHGVRLFIISTFLILFFTFHQFNNGNNMLSETGVTISSVQAAAAPSMNPYLFQDHRQESSIKASHVNEQQSDYKRPDSVLYQHLRDALDSQSSHKRSFPKQRANSNIQLRVIGDDDTPTLYTGPKDGCGTADMPIVFTDLWCSKTNPFAGTPEIFSDVQVVNKGEFQYKCGGIDSPLEDDCKGVVAIRAVDSSNGRKSFGRLFQFYQNGRVVMVNTKDFYNGGFTIYYKYPGYRELLKGEVYGSVTGIGDDQDQIALVQVTKYGKLNINGVFNFYQVEFYRYWFYSLDDNVKQVLDLKMFRDTQTQNVYSVGVLKIIDDGQKPRYQLIFIRGTVMHQNYMTVPLKWDVESDEDFRIETFIHFGNFSKTAPMRIQETFFERNHLANSRSLIMIYTSKQVRIVEFQDSYRKIDLVNSDNLNTFYQAPEGSSITVASPILDKLRKPIKLSLQTTCENVEFPPSQNLYIGLGLKKQGETNERYSFILHHIPEFVNYNFNFNEGNTANRPQTFNCGANQHSNNGKCLDNIQTITEMNDEVEIIKSSFMDINQTMNGISAYTETRHLNPSVICQFDYLKGGQIDTDQCMEDASKARCEIDIFTGAFTQQEDLFTFFFGYWQENIYISMKKNVQVLAISLNLTSSTPDDPSLIEQGYVAMTNNVNDFLALGKVIDLFVSENNQFLFLSITRKRWEIEANDRFKLVCDTLKTDPDNVFLKSFSGACNQAPPRDFNENQFAMLSSSCLRGNLCNLFRSTLVVPYTLTNPGDFIYRSLTRIPCLVESYCLSGIRIPCPSGYICPYIQMPYPLMCDGEFGKQTCFGSSLWRSEDCPDGTICTTKYERPLPVPPGYYIKKLKVGDTTPYFTGIESCKEGDYCNMARQVVIMENGTTTDNLDCPENTYCLNDTVIEPSLCEFKNDSMDYCPPGSYKKSLCPAGFYCENTHTIRNCSESQYCPEGSFTYKLCPESYYCPNASLKILCPAGYYCREGSIKPTGCSFFSNCPKGTKSDRMEFGGLAMVFIIMIIIAIIYVSYEAAFRFYVRYSLKNVKKHKRTKLFLKDVNENSNLLASDKPSGFRSNQFTVDIGFKDLGLTLKGSGKRVLDSVTGEIKHGKLTAVMGLSGAGKSTFITTLSNRAYYGTQLGQVFVNGKRDNLSNYNSKLGFVPQDDIMISSCTVEETLYFSAKTRLDASTPSKEIDAIVNDVIHVLNLQDVRHAIIGDQEKRGISGGQRKRVNVGIELVACPIAVFLDEPTSGLDSSSSMEVCQCLQEIAKSGMTVITVIHQPRYEIFNMFDNLLLLGKGGKTIYLGPVTRVEEYFEKELGFPKPNGTNLADFVIDVSAGLVPCQKDIEFEPSSLPEVWEMKKHLYEEETTTETNSESSINDQPEQVQFKNPRFSYFAHSGCVSREVSLKF